MSRVIWARTKSYEQNDLGKETRKIYERIRRSDNDALVNAERAFLGLPPLDRLHVSVQPPPKSSGDQNVQASSFPLSSWSSTSYLSWNPITKIILIVTQVTCEIETYGHAHGYP